METRKRRSPSHPTMDLRTAVEKVRAVYSAYDQSPIHRDVVATCIGYSPGSGPALQALASISAYGLLEKKLEKGELAVSQLAMAILYPQSPAEFAASLREAALQPTVFSQIAKRFGNHVPHEAGIRSLLNRDLGFTEKSAGKAAATYVTSMKYLETVGDNERSDAEGASAQTSSLSPAGSTAEAAGESEPVIDQAVGGRFEFKELARGSVGGDNTFRLLARDKLDASQWKRVMAHLQIELDIAEEEAKVSATAEANDLVAAEPSEFD